MHRVPKASADAPGRSGGDPGIPCLSSWFGLSAWDMASNSPRVEDLHVVRRPPIVATRSLARSFSRPLSLSLSFSLLLFLLLSRHPSFPYRPLACASQGADSPTCRERLPCSSTSIAPSCPSPRQPLLPSGSAYFTPAALALLLNSRHDNRSCHHGPPKER